VPAGASGYVVQPTSNAFFTGHANVVPLQDDQVLDQTLPFAFPHPGGTCTTAGFCSNGFVWLDNFNNAAPAAPFVPAFLFDGPRIAALWTDLDLTAGGAAYFDAQPTVAYFTWVDAPDFTSPNLRSTFQVQLFADGRIRLCYQGLAVGPSRPVLVGYGLGGATHDPGSIDLTASMPFQSGAGTLPVTLDHAGLPPVLGAPFPLVVDQLRPTAGVGFLVLGLTAFPLGVSLATQGMPNCFSYTSGEATLLFPVTAPLTNVNLVQIPGDAAFAGFPIHAQVAILDLGITPLGVASSNAGTMTVGFY
jgi:hypothetical protein